MVKARSVNNPYEKWGNELMSKGLQTKIYLNKILGAYDDAKHMDKEENMDKLL